MACAAIDDVSAWTLLAAGTALAQPEAYHGSVGRTLALLAAYAVVVIAAKPWLARLGRGEGPLSHGQLTGVVLAGMVSAAFTEWIGIHALFGAFFVGLVMPKKREFVAKVSGPTAHCRIRSITRVLRLYRITDEVAGHLEVSLAGWAVDIDGRGGG
jgi:Kef-type K+ transport system membrane component KefB